MRRIASCFLAMLAICGMFFACDLLPDVPPLATELPVKPEDVSRIGSKFGINNYGDESRFHGGIDFNPYEGKTAVFYAVADGIVSMIDRDTGQGYDGDKGARNYRIEISISKRIKVAYHFEAALDSNGVSLTPAEVDANIYVRKGQKVSAGDPIGLLPYRCGSTHVDFSIFDDYGIREGMTSIYDYFDDQTEIELRELAGQPEG